MTTARLREEDGAIAILYSALMLGAIGLLALVLDIGALRVDRRSAVKTADAASTAGSMMLEYGGAGGPAACEAAWRYVVANISDLPSTTSPCTAGPPPTGITWTCASPPANPTVEKTVGSYVIRITWPVPAGHALLEGEDYGPGIDGAACERIGVSISRTRGYIFGAWITPQGVTGGSAVARAIFGERSDEPAQLILLDKTGDSGCTALDTGGGGQVRVLATWSSTLSKWIPGKIYVDSNGTECGPAAKYTIDAPSTGSRIITEGDGSGAPGIIWLNAQPSGMTLCDEPAHACKQSQIDAGRIAPQPGNLPEQVNRKPGDWNFNCKADYTSLNSDPLRRVPSGSMPWNVPPCPSATATSNYIDQLTSGLGDGSVTTTPPGFQKWTAAGYSCAPSGIITVTGNWYIDCPSPSGFSVNGATVTFANGNVVFQNSVSIGTGGTLNINTGNLLGSLIPGCVTSVCLTETSDKAAFVYFRSGDFTQTANGSLEFNHVAVYMHPSGSGPEKLKLTGGNGIINWVAPSEGPFHKLALWSESSAKHSYAGQTGLELAGVYFTPNADSTFSGGTADNQTRAQFFTWRMRVTGSGEVRLQPDPDFSIPTPYNAGSRLIR